MVLHKAITYFFRLADFLGSDFFAFTVALGAAFAFRSLGLTAALARAGLDLAFAATFFKAFLTGFLDTAFAAFLRAGLAAFPVSTPSDGAPTWAIGSVSPRQPCASRTAIIARRMSFQVSCFIMTALGNMQPSQQMWRMAFVDRKSVVLGK